MMPIKLQIKNFLCYGEDVATLDFQEIELACLSGENGHGKTAILDAITWCLWGEAREIRKGRDKTLQDEFVRIGQKTAWVQLDFESQGQAYRVSKTKTVGRSIKLEFFMVVNGSLMPLTANTVPETEKTIEKVIKFSHETFINTSYMKQGEADMFTAANKTERKELLAKLLLLSSYDSFEKISKEESTRLQHSVQERNVGIEYKEQESESLAGANGNLERADTRIEELNILKKRDDAGLIMQERIDLLRNKVDSNQKQIHWLQTSLGEQKQILQTSQEIISRENEIDQGFNKFESLKKELGESIQKNVQYSNLQTQLSSLEQNISAAKAKYDAELSNIIKTIQDHLEPKVKRLPKIISEIQKESEFLSTLDSNQQNALKTKVDQKDEIANQINRLNDENSRLRGQHENMKNKFKMLESDDPKCPLCEQSLSQGAHTNLRKGYEDEGTSLNTQHKQNIGGEKDFNRSLNQRN